MPKGEGLGQRIGEGMCPLAGLVNSQASFCKTCLNPGISGRFLHDAASEILFPGPKTPIFERLVLVSFLPRY